MKQQGQGTSFTVAISLALAVFTPPIGLIFGIILVRQRQPYSWLVVVTSLVMAVVYAFLILG